MAGAGGHVRACLGLRLWSEGRTNERVTQVNIAWPRSNGCSSEQSVSWKRKAAHLRQDGNGEVELQASRTLGSGLGR